jgi:hypothetical protein
MVRPGARCRLLGFFDSCGSGLSRRHMMEEFKIEEFKVPSLVSDFLGALTHTVARSLFLLGHRAASLHLQLLQAPPPHPQPKP